MRALLGDPACPLLLDNEANLAARAEVEAPGRAGVRDLVLLTGVVGVGAGVVTAGRLLRGVRGFAGEVGHLQLDPGGRRCGCGRRGCWETVAGLDALLVGRRGRRRPRARPDARPRGAARARSTARAEAGDRRTLEALDRTAEWLGAGAGVLVNLFDPGLLVLGGYFALLGPWLAEPLRQRRCPTGSSRPAAAAAGSRRRRSASPRPPAAARSRR